MVIASGAALLVLSLLILLWARTRPGFDPYGWLVWGHQTIAGNLDTNAAPSWKPLPYLFTVPYGLFGHYQLWLWMVTSLAVSLADLPYPEAGDLPEGDVSDCRLPVGPGVRIFRMAEPTDGEGAPPIPLFSTTYLAQTDFGVLALAFATPHVDGAREFAVLFESIAKTCAIQTSAT